MPTNEVNLEDLEDALKRVQTVANSLNHGLENIESTSYTVDKKFNLLTVTLRGFAEEGNRVAQTFKKMKDGFQIVAESASLGSPGAGFGFSTALGTFGKLVEQIDQQASAIDSGVGKVNRMMKLAQQERAAEDAKEVALLHEKQQQIKEALAAEANAYYESQGKISRVIELGAEESAQNGVRELQQLHRDQEERKRILEAEVRDLQVADHQTEQEWARVNAARQRDIDLEVEEERERRDRVRQQQASQYGNLQGASTLTSQLRGQGPATFSTSTPGEYQRYISSIGRITSAVESGAISQQRAWTIVQETMARTGAVYTGVEAKVAAAAAGMQQSMDQLGQTHRRELERAENVGTGSATRIKITWQEVARFIQFRVAYAIGFHLVGAFQKASQEVREFEIRISEIRTLAQESGVTFEKWAEIVYNLSNKFGQLAEDVAKGLYETISNQIARGTDAAEFMSTAMRFAAVGVTTTANAVDLLSSAINAYQLSASDAERISSVLFKTIDLGRVRAEDLANAFGPTLQVASSLGVSFEEVNAALATITIQGVKPAVALTMLNNLFTKLLKPGAELTKAFHSIGVENGFAAIQTFGFMGTLQKLNEVSGESVSELANLFREQRAFRGINSIVQAFDGFKDTLKEMQGDTLPKYNKAFEIAMESSGRTVEIQLNKIRNYLLHDFGEAWVDMLAGKSRGGTQGVFADLIAGAGGLTGALEKLITVAKYAGEAFIVWKTATNFLIPGTNRLRAAVVDLQASYGQLTRGMTYTVMTGANQVTVGMGTMSRGMAVATTVAQGLGTALKAIFTSPAVLLTGAVLIWQYLADKEDELQQRLLHAREEGEKAAEAILAQSTKITGDEYARRNRVVETALDEEFRTRNQAIADIRALAERASKADAILIKRSTEVLRDSYQLVIRDLEVGIRHLESSANKALETAKRAGEQAARLSETADERAMKFQLQGLSPEAEIAKRIELARLMQEKGLSMLTAAGQSDSAEDAARLLEDGNKQLAKSAEMLGTIEAKREHIEEKAKALRQELADLGTKGGDRDDLIEQQKKLTQLEQQRADASHRHRNEDAATLDIQIRKQQQIIAQRREGDRDAKDATKAAQIQAELDGLSRQLGLLGDKAKVERAIADALKDQQFLNYLIEEQELDRAKRAEQQAEDQKKKVEDLKTAMTDIANFKLPKDFEKGQGDLAGALGNVPFGFGRGLGDSPAVAVTDALRAFDEAQARANKTGLLNDPATIKALADQRANLERQALREIQEYRLKLDSERLAKEKDAIIKIEKDRAKEQAKHQSEYLNPTAQSLSGLTNQLTTAMRSALDDRSGPFADKIRDLEYYQARLTQSFGAQESLAQAQKNLAEARTKPELAGKIPELERAVDELKQTIAEGSSEQIAGKFRKTLLDMQTAMQARLEYFAQQTGQRDSIYGSGSGTRDLTSSEIIEFNQIKGFLGKTGEIGETIVALMDAAKGQAKFRQEEIDYRTKIATLSKQLEDSLNAQAKLGDPTKTVETFNDRLNKSVEALKALEGSINSTSGALRAIIEKGPKAEIPSYYVPSGGSTASATNFEFSGEININYTGTGNTAVDGRQLSSAFLNSLSDAYRQGRAVAPTT